MDSYKYATIFNDNLFKNAKNLNLKFFLILIGY